MATLSRAHNEWAKRPADECYYSLESLHEAAVAEWSIARESEVSWKDLRAVAVDNDVVLVGPSEVPAKFTNWSFSQVARAAGAPPTYLPTLSSKLAAECINEGLMVKVNGDDGAIASLFLSQKDNDLTLRAATTDRYTRIANYDITKRLLDLQEKGWNPAPAAYDGKRGLYKGDRDMFVFLVDNDRRVFESLPGGGLSKGFFCWNSEVGAASFGIGTFLYEYICSNHYVWGAEDYKELRVRHIGEANARAFRELEVELKQYSEASTGKLEEQIQATRTFRLGTNKDELLDTVFGLRVPELTKKIINAGYEKAIEHEEWYGDPLTAWGFGNGLTEIARDLPYVDARVKLERAAQKVMKMAF